MGLSVLASLFFHVPLGTLFGRTVTGPGSDHANRYTKWALAGIPVVVLAVASIGAGVLRLPLPANVLACGLTATYCSYIYCRYAVLAVGRPLRGLVGELCVALALLLAGLLAVLKLETASLVLFSLSFGVFVLVVGALLRPRSRGCASQDSRRSERGNDVVSLLHVALGVISTNGPLQLLLILLTTYSPAVEGALAAAAFTLATPMSMLGQAIAPVLISNGARLDRDRRREEILRPVAVLGAVAIIAAFAVAGLAPILLSLFYGAGFTAATETLRILAMAMGLFNLGLIASAVLIGWGRNSLVVAAQAIGGVVFVAAALGWRYLDPGQSVIPIAYGIGTGLATILMSVVLVSLSRKTETS